MANTRYGRLVRRAWYRLVVLPDVCHTTWSSTAARPGAYPVHADRGLALDTHPRHQCQTFNENVLATTHSTRLNGFSAIKGMEGFNLDQFLSLKNLPSLVPIFTHLVRFTKASFVNAGRLTAKKNGSHKGCRFYTYTGTELSGLK